MLDVFKDLYESTSTFDSIYFGLTILSLIKCTRKGFILSLLSASKWLLAYIITLILFPRLKPYVENIINNNYILDVFLGVSIFVIVMFLIFLISKGISKTISYSSLGAFDTLFGFFFGFLRGYIVSVCIFSTVTILYNQDKWPMNTNESLTFSYVKKGSNYLIKEFPDEKNYKDAKEKIEEL